MGKKFYNVNCCKNFINKYTYNLIINFYLVDDVEYAKNACRRNPLGRSCEPICSASLIRVNISK
jgi:hypothetical protein